MLMFSFDYTSIEMHTLGLAGQATGNAHINATTIQEVIVLSNATIGLPVKVYVKVYPEKNIGYALSIRQSLL